MYRRRFVVLFLGTTSLAGCISRDSDTSDTQPTKETEVETSTATRRTAEGITATFRVVDSHTPTSDTAEATFDDTEAIVTGKMDPSGCNRPLIGSVQYNSTDGVATLLISTESPYDPTTSVECGNASYDYRCVLGVDQGSLSAIEVVHQYDGKDHQSFSLIRN